MLDSIFIGTSGLQGFSKGLKTISNNVANLNTPGFKSSSVQFADLYYQNETGQGSTEGQPTGQFGTGMATLGTTTNFAVGETRQTGNPLDMSINGAGYFVLRDQRDGALTYSRAGQFEIDKAGTLVNRSDAHQVMGYAAGSGVGPITLDGLRLNPAKATSNVKFTGNLLSTANDFALSSVKVFDSLGAEHTLKLAFTRDTATAGQWAVKVSEGDTELANVNIRFDTAGIPVAGSNSVAFTYSPSGAAPTALTLDFASNVTSLSSGASTSTLAVGSVDGYAVGNLTQVTVDKLGFLTVTYSNGQKATGSQLQLATFENNQGLQAVGAGQFINTDPKSLHVARAAADGLGQIEASKIETSNVDLSAEFSDLIVMQRGYQASSRVVSTSNDMLQELFDLRGKR